MINWITSHWVEVVGAILALVYLFLEVKRNWTMWIIGIVSSIFYIVIFYEAKLYAEMGMNGYYVIMSIYGLYCWKLAKPKVRKNVFLHHITLKPALIILGVLLILWAGIVYILSHYTDSTVPMADAFVATLGIVATWMVAQKIVECWVLWIIANFFAIGLYLYQGLYPTAILYVFYGIMSIVGLLEWNKAAKKAL